MGNKRKSEVDIEESARGKKAKTDTTLASNSKTPQATSEHRAPDASANQRPSQRPDAQSNPRRRPRIRKLAPPRPFPTVALASSATGPCSLHHEGKNNICVTRKTKLAAYLRRCKALLIDDGFKELRLSAMGAAIPHLALLAVSLPPILPWSESEVHVDIYTGSVEVHDEVLSESGSDEEASSQEEYQTRTKSTMNVVIRIGQGEAPTTSENGTGGPALRPSDMVKKQASEGKGADVPQQIVLQEGEQGGMETC